MGIKVGQKFAFRSKNWNMQSSLGGASRKLVKISFADGIKAGT
jgi:hypothetical protein